MTDDSAMRILLTITKLEELTDPFYKTARIRICCEKWPSTSALWLNALVDRPQGDSATIIMEIQDAVAFGRRYEELRSYGPDNLPCGFTASAQMAAQEALAWTPSDAGVGDLARACLGRITELGTGFVGTAKRRPRAGGQRTGEDRAELGVVMRYERARWTVNRRSRTDR